MSRSQSSRLEMPYRDSINWKIAHRLCCTVNALTNSEETMQTDQKERAREVSYYILAYLYENPEAGDTFDGIVEWWLLRQRIKFETRNVSAAVTKLVSDGLIVEHEGSDSRIFYRVNRTKEQDVKSLLMREGSFVD